MEVNNSLTAETLVVAKWAPLDALWVCCRVILNSWLSFGNPELPWGISLGLVLAALSFNIKVIRDFSASKKARAQSQRFAFLLAIYAFLVFGLEMI